MNRNKLLIQYFERHDGTTPSTRLNKHEKMAASAFHFFRGTAPLMYSDIFDGVIDLPASVYDIPVTMIMGDCHTSNFGFLSEEGSHGETLVFTPNDFDDACVGHAIWDIFRFLVSLNLAQQAGLDVKESTDSMNIKQKPAVLAERIPHAQSEFLAHYVATCEASLRGENNSQSALTDFDKDHILHKRWQKGLQRLVGGSAFNVKSTLAKDVELTSVPLRFKADPLKFEPIHNDIKANLLEQFRPYVDDDIIDCVERLDAGTGSNHLKRFYLLVGPKDLNTPELYHIIEVKQQTLAAPLHYFKDLSPINRLNHAHLTVNCQRQMQRRPDLIIDDALWQGVHWLVRSRHHARVGIDPEHITLGKRAAEKNGFEQYAKSCAQVLAYAHMRGDRRSMTYQEHCITTLPPLFTALVSKANQYAKQVNEDWELFKALRK
ncbi:DUF2252 family protein [Pseudoalteromonas luteoviolacea]|uniref:DUF2252 domain-containing protein n=1 Tax=Pseudoalteromonas luteoviolacea S4054 TaxID=1129367 RepID=A0A0F6A5L8_9GAMM|nr:DUF2252 family protein [Pseudoalteromonas luteoviolacea]AOT10543.1 hypothetical protein S4054249_22020 [Pseudoalteromonas luteoviolacea]AOT15389.1 hypothetical protein S40542_21575 [Pseudoalteromonas luteoviolacea]AOT20362.1 hypothetical protein S4054_21935 [Pseudoalteromonas luteoviolacea]KKE81497.1 hypothetical protein N479_03155 [Pseudoalteromonas luteoviolacea S4054]KZN71606.1 hypothetical protein N481_18225 [Pseudoalteromonas luteoviolacea S4047-1]